MWDTAVAGCAQVTTIKGSTNQAKGRLRKESEKPHVKLARKGAIAAIGASAAFVALSSSPALAQETLTPSPYAPPQNPTGVPYDQFVSVLGSGLPVGAKFSVATCDGVPITSSTWSPSNDCSPFFGPQTVPSSGQLTFGGDADTSSATDPAAFLLWHGSNAQDTVFGEMPFNCLAPDDNPNGTVTTEGNQNIDSNEPAWGSSQGGNASGGGTAPCQVVITENPFETVSASTDVAIPINLTAAPASPESPLAIALPIGAVLLLGGGSLVMIRRRRRSTALA